MILKERWICACHRPANRLLWHFASVVLVVCCHACVGGVVRDQVEGLRGKEALVQAVVKNIARKEVKEPETRSDDELRVALRAKGEQTAKVGLSWLLCLSSSLFFFFRGCSSSVRSN